jgi:carotenoid cleavage dioxygenase-like enzyme
MSADPSRSEAAGARPQTASRTNAMAAPEHETSVIPDLAPGLDTIFPREFTECDGALECVAGEVPDFVRGRYYLNGPARFGWDDFSYRHWLDGDGMILSLDFNEHGVGLKSRYIRSTKFLIEQQALRPVFRTFGTEFEASRLNRVNNGLESPVNVSVYPFRGRLLALGEQGLPWELDPETLETRGPFTFDGRLNEASPFAAHPKIDVASDEMFNFGNFFSPAGARLYLYCFGADGLRYRKATPLEYPCSVHDFTLSRQHTTFYLSPYLLDAQAVVQGRSTVMDSLRWEPERGSSLLILSRTSGEPVARIPIGNRYCLHLINSFEQNHRLFVDVVELDEPVYGEYQPVPLLFENVAPGRPVRFVVDLNKRELVERQSISYSSAPDFPAIDQRHAMQPCEELWMLGISRTGDRGRKFFDQLVHATWSESAPSDIYQAEPMHYLGGEPIFVGARGSAEGVIICQEFDAQRQRCFFLLFEAHNVRRGPIARLASEWLLPLGFHAAFSPKERNAE